MLATALLVLLAAQSPAPLVEVEFKEGPPRTGKIFMVDVTAPPNVPGIVSITSSLNWKSGVGYVVDAEKEGSDAEKKAAHHWRLLLPVDIESNLKKPQSLLIDVAFSDGRTTRWKKPISVVDGKYDKRDITVGSQFTSPSKAQRLRAERESKELSAAMAVSSKEKLWRGSFVKPTPGEQTSPFGTLRTYNKKRRSRHMGLDLDGDVGAPIVAANRGRVLIATERFYSGGTVLVDHGQGLMTMYFHMSRIDVKAGKLVEKGEGLGAVGASGQVTGPHLHLSTKLGGEYVDSAQLLRLDLDDDVDSGVVAAPVQRMPQ